MARRRFFTPPPRRGQIELCGPEAEHLTRVLRVESGQRFELSDNDKLYLAEVESARKALVVFRIVEELPTPAQQVRVDLLPALFKFDRFEWLVEKATELGVWSIQPWEATRSETGLAQAAGKRLARWQKIAQEASQQSRRAYLPEIRGVSRSREAFEIPGQLRLLLDEASGAPPVLEVVPAERRQEDQVALLLGPEGGFTDIERKEALAAGWQACSLGSTILRAETAGLAALAVIQAAWAPQR